MSTYLQLGHDSANLLDEQGLHGFSGVVLSPVNYAPKQTKQHILPRLEERSLDLVFDPQLYNPRSTKASLTAWSYFPSDYETAISNDIKWWTKLVDGLAKDALEVSASKICSPSPLPRVFDNSYYGFSNSIYRALADRLDGSDATPYQTLVVDYRDIGVDNRAYEIASIAIQARPFGVYLVVLAEVRQRLELDDTESLHGLMLLIHLLEQAGIPVLMSHASSDVVLWKAAGATACSTGKFFNLRRFSKSRFGDSDESRGQQFAYWFEEGLLAFLRQGDVIRLTKYRPQALGLGNSTNPYGGELLTNIREHPEKNWVGLGWRQYLSWFILTEASLNSNGLQGARRMLEVADSSWQALEDESHHLMEERTNDGRWVRQWRLALMAFERSLRTID